MSEVPSCSTYKVATTSQEAPFCKEPYAVKKIGKRSISIVAHEKLRTGDSEVRHFLSNSPPLKDWVVRANAFGLRDKHRKEVCVPFSKKKQRSPKTELVEKPTTVSTNPTWGKLSKNPLRTGELLLTVPPRWLEA